MSDMKKDILSEAITAMLEEMSAGSEDVGPAIAAVSAEVAQLHSEIAKHVEREQGLRERAAQSASRERTHLRILGTAIRQLSEDARRTMLQSATNSDDAVWLANEHGLIVVNPCDWEAAFSACVESGDLSASTLVAAAQVHGDVDDVIDWVCDEVWNVSETNKESLRETFGNNGPDIETEVAQLRRAMDSAMTALREIEREIDG